MGSVLEKITAREYLVTSLIIFLAVLIYQIHSGQDCAWDGCYPTTRPTIIGTLFGLPALVLEIEAFLGIIAWIITKVKR